MVKNINTNITKTKTEQKSKAQTLNSRTKIKKEKSKIKNFPSEIIIPPTSRLSSAFGNIHKYKVGDSLRTFSHRF